MYDLTSFLTTIVAASSSIVAILGGFIASKLISINNDRMASVERIKQINEELNVRISEQARLQEENDSDDSLDFIRDHMKDLADKTELDVIYGESDHYSLSQEVMSVYWEKAINVFDRYCSALTEEKAYLNGDKVPTILAIEYKDDDFCYAVCKEIGSKIKTGQDENSPYLSSPLVSDFSSHSYFKNKDLISEQKAAISLLELQRKQTEEQLEGLKKPKGMKLGLGIFAVFAISCIICPLMILPFSTESFRYYATIKYGFLGVLFVCLAIVFIYLVWLLKWDNEDQS